ncbi:MAG: serine hydrolase domain-containing protein, partial [Pseudomonadota bacterium]
MPFKTFAPLAGALTLAASPLWADSLPAGDPAALGFSPERLEAIDAMLQARIDGGDFPGAVVMVAREGQAAHLAALGARTEGGEAMAEDAIFRIYSMTKPVTSVVAMMLVEEGRLGLSDPLGAYMPEYAEMTVLADGAAEAVPAVRPIRVHDLLLHTAGMTYGFFGAGPAREALKAANLEGGGFDNRQIARRIGELPLEHQPGEVWEYSRSTDVLGALIEVVEGKTLGEVFEERVFGPLGMEDTGFWIEDEAARGRFAEARADDMKIGPLDMFDPMQPRVFESGGGGLVSTVHDYARFAQMLLNGGEYEGARLLSPKTVAYMTADHMTGRGKGKYYLPGAGYGFGLGFGVRLEDGTAPAMGSTGEYYWGGAAGTYVW